MQVIQLCTAHFPASEMTKASEMTEAPCLPASEAPRWWDVVCLLAHDERQREFFESMLHCRRSVRLLPLHNGCEYLVVIAAASAGSGVVDVAGRLLESLPQIEGALQQRCGSCARLEGKRVLVVDGAGYPTRIPNLNVKGTLFAPMPAALDVPGFPVGTVLDYKLIESTSVAQHCCAGIFFSTGDLCSPSAAANQVQAASTTVPLGDQQLRVCLLDSQYSNSGNQHLLY